MATNAKQDLDDVRIETMTIASAQTTTVGLGVIRSGADDTVATAGANGNCLGVALETGVAAAKVQIAMFGGSAGVIPVKVGTGGATQGAYAIATSDGFTDQTLGGGTTVKYVVGKFAQTGVVGDIVGLYPGQFAAGAA